MRGKKIGRLTVIKQAGNYRKNGQIIWECRCDCGKLTKVLGCSLRNGATKSCGCWNVDVAKTHGKTGTSVHKTWQAMRQRCENPNSPIYKNYGARGIKVCERWQRFESFFEDMGEKPTPKHTLDRIDNDGNYEPSNCRWATHKEQAQNTRLFGKTEYRGYSKTPAEWISILREAHMSGKSFDDTLLQHG